MWHWNSNLESKTKWSHLKKRTKTSKTPAEANHSWFINAYFNLMLVPKKDVKFVDVTDTVATNLSISFHRHKKYTKNYRSHCFPNSELVEARIHVTANKQFSVWLHQSRQIWNCSLLPKALFYQVTSGNRQHGSACCSPSGTQQPKPPALSTAPALPPRSPAPPHLSSSSLLCCFQITLSIFAFAQAYKCSWFPSFLVCFSLLLSPLGSSNWCPTWALSSSHK